MCAQYYYNIFALLLAVHNLLPPLKMCVTEACWHTYMWMYKHTKNILTSLRCLGTL